MRPLSEQLCATPPARHSDRAPVSAWKCVSTWRMMRRSAAEKSRWARVKGSPLRHACRASPTDAIRRSSGAPPTSAQSPPGSGRYVRAKSSAYRSGSPYGASPITLCSSKRV
jgi:hypothetical protein